MVDNAYMFAERTNKWVNQGLDKVHIIICICVYGLMVEMKYLFWGYHNHVLNQLKIDKEEENEGQNNTFFLFFSM